MPAFRYALSLSLFVLVAGTAPAQPLFDEVADAFDVAVSSWGASWVDYDGDNDLDLFVSRFALTGGNVLFRNAGGAFEAVDAGALTDADTPGSLGHTWADYDNDGDLDVYAVGGWQTGAGHLFRNDGGTFAIVGASPIGPADDNRGWSAAWGDSDSDGLVDLVVAHPQGFVGMPSQPNHFFHNDGGDAFSRITGTPITDGLAPYTIPSWADYDLDGDLDLFIGSGPISSAGPDHLYANEGGGAFTRIMTDPIATDPRDGQVMNWIDYDNDGDLDLYVTSYSQATNKLYRNDSDGSGPGPYVEVTDTPLNEPVDGLGLANTWGDLDNDGDLDVVVSVARGAAAQTGYNKLYLNGGDGTFTAVEKTPLTATQESTSGATLGDYDDDGDLDLAVTSQSANTPNIRLYENTTDGAGNWLKLNLVGDASNRAAVGARVRASATIGGATVTQLREVSAQNTFGGQNALTVHFGLGDAAEVDELEITWPSGAVDTFTGVAANGFLEATEGQGLVAVAGEPGAAAPPAVPTLEAFPNPFATAATFRYTLPEAGPVRLAVYDLLGREVAVLTDAVRPAGPHTATFTASGLAPGIYLYRLEVGGHEQVGRLVLAR
ncbi:MAG: FG-GAP-like repeat-containing protein [Rhodothermales bacterium]|nr:FG-GAP-like repeat-containing protein [Rhodothermales bacterium]